MSTLLMKINFSMEQSTEEKKQGTITTKIEIVRLLLQNLLAGDALTFSQMKEQPSSPLIRKIGALVRKDTWNRPDKMLELVNVWCKDESCELHFGLLQEHANSVLRIISAMMPVKKDASVFHSAVEDFKNSMLINETIDEHLLQAHVRCNKSDVPGRCLPETNKHPPTNETMMVVPPLLRDWGKKHKMSLVTLFLFPVVDPNTCQREKESNEDETQVINLMLNLMKAISCQK